MQVVQESEFGYDYTIALISAIEIVCKNEEDKNPLVFTYEGLNLIYAVERSLYFSFANSKSLYKIFSEWKTNTLPEKIKVDDDVELKLISEMCKIDLHRIEIVQHKNIKRFIKPTVRLAVLILRLDKIAKFIRSKINAKEQKGLRYPILFYTINDRFVRFMKPIFDKMPEPCAYITENKITRRYLLEQKIPYIKISSFLYAINRIANKDSWLKRFLIIERYEMLMDSILRLRPKTIALVEGNASQYEVINQICKKLDINCVCIQQGWSPIVHNGFRNMSYTKMLIWGEGFEEMLAPFNLKQAFKVTGSFVINNSEPKIQEESQKIKVGFLPPMATKILSQKKLDEFMTLVPWTANQFKNAEIRISEHPTPTIHEIREVGDFSKFSNITVLSTRTHSLQEIIGGNDIAVSFFSTTILESIAAGALPIIVNLTAMPSYFPDVDKEGAGVEVRSIEEAKQILTDFITHKEKILSFSNSMKKFKEKYFTDNREQAMINIIKEII